ncbi:MAG: polysaccharide biosynthesis protein [Anaerolineales bacterium]|nr:polysaccharide biosynthesis protein [Anaerolineales bacterium]
MSNSFVGARILITGGTGSFGEFAISRFLEDEPEQIVVYSRDEYKQFNLQRKYAGDKRLHFVLGDVRDEARLTDALVGVDVVIHAAAMKQVPACEMNPSEAILTNVLGAHNVVRSCLRSDVSSAINLSPDKATMPGGVYGATKLLSERVFSHGGISQASNLRAASIRYSNVLGTRGSVVEVFEQRLRDGFPLVVFDPRMIRLVLTQDQVVDLACYAFDTMLGGEVFIKDSPALRIVDLAQAMVDVFGSGEVIVKDQDVRAGEKYDAYLLSASEAENTLMTQDGYFVILPSLSNSQRDIYTTHYQQAKAVAVQDYGSSTARLLSKDDIVKMIGGIVQDRTSFD